MAGFSMYRGCVKALIWATGLFENRGEKFEYSVEKEIIYTPCDWAEKLRGDFYRPDVEGDIPVVLLVHGGGWAENDNRYQMVRIIDQLVRAGFAVFNVAYRLAPAYHFPAPVDDILEAIGWLKVNEERLRIDMDSLALFGYSAGGHLVELAEMRVMPEGVNVRAVVAGGTPHFMRLDPDFPLVVQFMGQRWMDDPDHYRRATPVDQIDKMKGKFPPVFIYHGLKDQLVPRQHVDKWEKKLRELSIDHEVHWVKGRGHIGTFLLPRKSIHLAVRFMNQYF